MGPNAGFPLPEMLWLLVAVVPLLVLWTFVRRFRTRRLARWMEKTNWPLLADSVSTRARFHKGVLILLAVIFSVVAAARPYWGTTQRVVQSRGVNILFAIDVSQSMLAADVLPNRLEHARSIMRQILVTMRGHRAGLIPFAGDAFLQCPLTNDYGIMLDVIKQVDTTTISYPGTNIPEVIDLAIKSFEASGSGERVLVLLTDGEDHSTSIEQAARRAAEAEIRIFALGIGSPDGAPIIMPDGRFKEDSSGIKVLSRLNPDILTTLADATGGRAYMANQSGRLDPGPLLDDLDNLQRSDLGERRRIVRHERFQFPLALALLCLLVEMMIPDRRRAPRASAIRETTA